MIETEHLDPDLMAYLDGDLPYGAQESVEAHAILPDGRTASTGVSHFRIRP